jgi:hypothetical protein
MPDRARGTEVPSRSRSYTLTGREWATGTMPVSWLSIRQWDRKIGVSLRQGQPHASNKYVARASGRRPGRFRLPRALVLTRGETYPPP